MSSATVYLGTVGIDIVIELLRAKSIVNKRLLFILKHISHFVKVSLRVR